MSVQYRLPCGCGQSVRVSEAQAGSTASCACGAVVAIPMLRDLRKLPHDETPAASPSNARPSGSWNPRQAALFAAGGVTFLALLISGVLILGRARLDVSWTPELQKMVDDELVDSLEPIQTIGAYREMRTMGLGEQQPTSVMLNIETHQKLGVMIRWSLAVAAAGAVVWLAVAFIGPRKSSA